jgi:site-specific recombinase XerD
MNMNEENARIYRRHRPKCKFFGVKDSWSMLNCNCPLYGDGYVNGKRVLRKSLDTRNQATASKRLGELMARCGGDPGGAAEPKPEGKSISAAIEAFLAQHGTIDKDGYHRILVAFSTYRKYRNSLRKLEEFSSKNSIRDLCDLGLEQLDAFRTTRGIKPKTYRNELQCLRKFWTFCVKRKWVLENVAKDVDAPKNLPDNEIVPYTPLEESRILSACDSFGRNPYERLRAKAMMQIHRFTGLAISDVATLERHRVEWDEPRRYWKVMVRRQKQGAKVFLPIPAEVKMALDALPAPRKAAVDCPFFFWNGVTSRRAVVGIAERAMSAVFKKSGVKDAGTHRFRHTLATRLLGRGAKFEEIADILGNTPEIVRKHYAKWSKPRQDRIDSVMIDYVGDVRRGEAEQASGYNLGTDKKGGCN